MGIDTAISYVDHSWNPWQGCNKVGDDCRHCYMYREKDRFGQDPTVVVRSTKPTFNFPLSNKVRPGERIFVCSWSDFFHQDADAWRAEAWAIIRKRIDNVFVIPTKRTDRVLANLPLDWDIGYPHVWLLASVGSQQYINRWDDLRFIHGAVRGISYEPAIGPLDLTGHETPDWLIAGGESGPGFRVANPQWFIAIRDYCLRQQVPFYFKQWGGVKKVAGVYGGDLLSDIRYHQLPPSF